MGFVTISLDTTQLQGSTVKGIIVKTNDPRNMSVILTLRSHILGSVNVLPHSVTYMRRRSGQAPVAWCLIRQEPTERGTLFVSGVTTSDDRLVATAHKLEQARPRGDGVPRAERTSTRSLESKVRRSDANYLPSEASFSC